MMKTVLTTLIAATCGLAGSASAAGYDKYPRPNRPAANHYAPANAPGYSPYAHRHVAAPAAYMPTRATGYDGYARQRRSMAGAYMPAAAANYGRYAYRHRSALSGYASGAADYDSYAYHRRWHRPHAYVSAYNEVQDTGVQESYAPSYTYRQSFSQGYNYAAAQPSRYGYGEAAYSYGQAYAPSPYPASTIAYVPTTTYRPIRVYYTQQTQPFYNVPPYLAQ